jgi:hypothetical protein
MKRAFIVKRYGRRFETAFMVWLNGPGNRCFYDKEGYAFMNWDGDVRHEDDLGKFVTWEEFEGLTGVRLQTLIDICAGCDLINYVSRSELLCLDCRVAVHDLAFALLN